MTQAEIRAKLAAIVKSIAPEADLERVRENENLRQALDIDSFDFLNLVMAIHRAFGVEIPEADYVKIDSLGALTRYLEHAATA